MARFDYAGTLTSPATSSQCIASIEQALTDISAKPQTQGKQVVGYLGSERRMKMMPGPLTPAEWLPIRITLSVFDMGALREVSLEVAEIHGIVVPVNMEKKFRERCHTLARELQATLARKLPESKFSAPTAVHPEWRSRDLSRH